MRHKSDPSIHARQVLGRVTDKPFTEEDRQKVYERFRREALEQMNWLQRMIFYVREWLSRA